MLRTILLFLFFVYFGSLHAAEDPLSNFLHELNSLESQFSQTLINEEGEALEQSSGILYLKQPGKFHWSYQQPYSQQIISDSESLWIYDEDLEQVTIRSIQDTLTETPAGIILGETDIDSHFVQIDLGNIDGYDWIELTPRDLESQYRTIKIGFNDNALGMMIIDDNLGQTTRIDFSEVNRNTEIEDEFFSLNVPDDVDVIDERVPNQ